MRRAKVKECRVKGNISELFLFIDNQKQAKKYEIKISPYDAKLLKKGVECEFEGDDREIRRLIVNGKEIRLNKPSKEEPSKQVNHQSPQSGANINPKNTNNNAPKHSNNKINAALVGNTAKAPYNFVPINEVVIPVPKPPNFDKYDEKYYTGYIKLKIKALTPLYIRDTYTQAEADKVSEAETCGEKWENPDFFSPGGEAKIPGSSLRGMVRNLVEIVSYSKMLVEGDKRLYYRKIVDKNYQERMLSGKNSAESGLYPASIAGWLSKENGRYYIYPLENQQIYRINAKADKSKWKVKGQLKEAFDYYPISFIPAKEKVHFHRNNRIKLRYALIDNNNFEWGHQKAAEDNNYEKGYLVLTGSIGNKHMHPVIHCPQKEGAEEINQDIIANYSGDISRNPNANLLEKADKGIPCFYLKNDEGKVISFGHTPFFRLAYERKIEAHIPVDNNFKGVDFAIAIFGNADEFAGRVFFEDAKIVKDDSKEYGELSPKILSTPKPTTVQHYLQQRGGKILDWNDDTPIRGYKQYWHRKTTQQGVNNWQATDDEIKEAPKQYTRIKPLKQNSTFTGRIRFENLSDIELGALMFALKLPDDCAHKIGMGKPLGLGSIRIDPELYITNRIEKDGEEKGRYGKLFAGKQWHLASEEADINKYKNDFAKYILDNLPESNKKQNLWAVPRIRELKALLYYNENEMQDKDWLENTRYQSLDEFKNRSILSSPTATLKRVDISIDN